MIFILGAFRPALSRPKNALAFFVFGLDIIAFLALLVKLKDSVGSMVFLRHGRDSPIIYVTCMRVV